MTRREPEPDPVEWVRKRWLEQGMPEADRFATAASLMRTHQLVTAQIAEALRPHGLNRTGYLMLVTLALSKDGTRRMSYLARYLLVHQTTVTQLVDSLERRGLLTRRPHPSDRRTTLVVLSAAGRELLSAASSAAAATGFGLSSVELSTVRALGDSLGAARSDGLDQGH